MHRLPGSKHSDQVKELWKRKGLKWPGSVVASEVPMPVDEEEEDEQFQMALKESLEKQHISEIGTLQANQTQTTNQTVVLVPTTQKQPSFLWI